MEGRKKFYSVNMFRVCVDEFREDISGWVYTPLSEESLFFAGIGELLLNMDKLFDSIGYPQGFQNKRSFDAERSGDNLYRGIPEPVMPVAKILKQKGLRCTYDIEVESRRNTSWQGKIYDTQGTELGKFDGEVELLTQLIGLAE